MAGRFQVINGVAVLLESARGRSLVGMGLGHLTNEAAELGEVSKKMKGYKNSE